jgi:hypothetical protein
LTPDYLRILPARALGLLAVSYELDDRLRFLSAAEALKEAVPPAGRAYLAEGRLDDAGAEGHRQENLPPKRWARSSGRWMNTPPKSTERG